MSTPAFGFAVTVLWLLAPPALAHPPSVKVETFISRVVAAETKHWLEQEEYTFAFERTWKRYSNKGKLFSEEVESGETYMSHLRDVNIPLKWNGLALKPKTLERQRRAAIARLEEDARVRRGAPRELNLAERPGPGMSYRNARMSVMDVLRFCSLSEPKLAEELLEATFDQCASKWPDEAHFPHIRGVVRVHPQTYGVVTWMAWIKSGPSVGSLFFEERTQEVPGGSRVPQYKRLNLAAAPHLFPKDRIDWSFRWTNPQRFNVQVEQTVSEPAASSQPR